MNIIEVIKLAKKSKKPFARNNWNSKFEPPYICYLFSDDRFENNTDICWYPTDITNISSFVRLTAEDILADDWEMVKKANGK